MRRRRSGARGGAPSGRARARLAAALTTLAFGRAACAREALRLGRRRARRHAVGCVSFDARSARRRFTHTAAPRRVQVTWRSRPGPGARPRARGGRTGARARARARAVRARLLSPLPRLALPVLTARASPAPPVLPDESHALKLELRLPDGFRGRCDPKARAREKRFFSLARSPPMTPCAARRAAAAAQVVKNPPTSPFALLAARSPN